MYEVYFFQAFLQIPNNLHKHSELSFAVFFFFFFFCKIQVRKESGISKVTAVS